MGVNFPFDESEGMVCKDANRINLSGATKPVRTCPQELQEEFIPSDESALRALPPKYKAIRGFLNFSGRHTLGCAEPVGG